MTKKVNSQFELYKKYNLDKNHTMENLFKKINTLYKPKKVLYPGCYVHITPSLIFENVTYVDSFKNTNLFYKNSGVLEYINKNKKYTIPSKITFLQQDYNTALENQIQNSFNLIISQFAGFIGQATKKYLKLGGKLLCNNSHGDASMAHLDSDYKLISIYNKLENDTYVIETQNLEKYFMPKKQEQTKKELEISNKGTIYTINPTGYIFEKIK